jgi:hypothetical protein
MMSSTRFRSGVGDGAAKGSCTVGVSGRSASAGPAASRRMVRISSYMERPWCAARSRNRFFSASSSWRTVSEATDYKFSNSLPANDSIEITAINRLRKFICVLLAVTV